MDKLRDMPVDYAKVTFTLLIFIAGIIANGAAIFVVVVLKEYKKSITHWYVLQLAIADSLFLLTLPFKASQDLHNSWLFPEWMCKANETILFINYYASILFLMVMSVDRYIAVCQTFSIRFQLLRKKPAPFIITFVVWLIAIGLSVPLGLYSVKKGHHPHCTCKLSFPSSTNKNNDSEVKNCHVFVDNNSEESASGDGQEIDDITFFDTFFLQNMCRVGSNQVWLIAFISYNFAVMFLLPLLVMLVCYGLIVRRFQSTSIPDSGYLRNANSSSGANTRLPKESKKSKLHSQPSRDRRRVTIMCASLVACFIICWLPYHSVRLAQIAEIHLDDWKNCRKLHFMGSIFAFLNSAANPCLYTFLATNFSQRWRTATTTVREYVSSRKKSSSDTIARRKYRSGKKKTMRKERQNPSVSTRTNSSSSKTGFELKPMNTRVESVSSPANNLQVRKTSSVAPANVGYDIVFEEK